MSITVRNVGRRDGIAVPQLYLSLPSRRGVPQPPKALKGFVRVRVVAGRKKTVNFNLDRRAFSYWNAGKDEWNPVPGCARVLVGSSSRNTPLRSRIRPSGPCPR